MMVETLQQAMLFVQFIVGKIPGIIEMWEQGEANEIPQEAWDALKPRSKQELRDEVDEAMGPQEA